MEFVVGLLLGYLFGSLLMWRYMKSKSVVKVKMDAKDAANFIESDEAVKRLKKELNL